MQYKLGERLVQEGSRPLLSLYEVLGVGFEMRFDRLSNSISE